MKSYSKLGTQHQEACKTYREAFLQEHGYLFCEVGLQSALFRYQVHHIYYASRFPKHENLHDSRNLILLCSSCHRKFHAGEMKEKFLELEESRGLKELFS